MTAAKLLAGSACVLALATLGACDDDSASATTSASASTTGQGGGSAVGTGGTVATGGSGGAGGGAGGLGGEGGAAPMADWSCLGSTPAPSYSNMPPVTVSYRARDYNSLFLAGATIRLCAYTDPTCASPSAEGTADSMGDVTLLEPVDARQFVETSAAGYLTNLNFRNGPPVIPSGPSTTMFSSGALASRASAAGATLDPNRGHLRIIANDCLYPLNPGVAGVAMTIDTADNASTLVYLDDDGQPALSATETTPGGQLWAYNLPPGEATISATLVASNTPISIRTVHVRANAMSWAATIDPAPPAQ